MNQLFNLSSVKQFSLAFVLAAMAAQLSAAELIMIEEDDCVFCKKFNREIAHAYPKTTEGKLAPLRRLDLADPWPADLVNVKKALFTPTFILMSEGREIDRLIGYPGDEHFWFLLGEMLEKLES